MTISSSINKAQYTANGATTIFAFNFLIPSSQDIQVFLGDALQSSGFTVSGYGNPSGGSVTFTTAPQNLWIVTILRVMPLTQAVDYVPYDAFPAQTHEGALDKLTMIDQQLQEQIDRSLKISVSAPDTNVIIDAPVDEAILTWELGVPGTSRIKNGPSAQSIQSSVDSAANSAASAAGSAASAGSSASAAAASAAAAEEAANNLTANKYEETTTVVKSVFTIPFAISTMAPNVMIMINGVVQPPSAYTVTDSTTITLDEALPIGTNFYLAAAAPPTLPNFTDIVRTSAPATLGQDLIFNGSLWTPGIPRHKNFFINGGMEVQQRAEALITDINPQYGKADRWRAILASTAPMSCSLTAGTFGGVYTRQALFLSGLQVTAGFAAISQRIEAKDTIKLANKTITISATMYHDFGPTQPFGIVVERPTTNADDYTARTDVHISAGTNIPNLTPAKVSTTFFMTEANAEKGLQVTFQPFQNNSFSGKTLALAEAQLEIGSIATPFDPRPYAEELALCLRYYNKCGYGATGTVYTANVVWVALTYPPMRVDPGILKLKTNPTIRITGASNATAVASELSDAAFSRQGGFFTFTGFTGLAVGAGVCLVSEDFIALSAEL